MLFAKLVLPRWFPQDQLQLLDDEAADELILRSLKFADDDDDDSDDSDDEEANVHEVFQISNKSLKQRIQEYRIQVHVKNSKEQTQKKTISMKQIIAFKATLPNSLKTAAENSHLPHKAKTRLTKCSTTTFPSSNSGLLNRTIAAA
ncbi:unnamed protein product [Ambrosiozyma monospora]|uniref:Unnamed protein product n=1 Tax=Ambrosiozyma monospora TaxID=43982 RepID=A0ACB5TKE2_AMBMO|nr:unnamed protein product [Ambrosiozyma monospora]